MALIPGTRLGVYEITAPLGEGGMGQVWRSRDTKLDRDVAIKVLPEAFAHDADRLARFTREAKTLAALNHPSIAHIHGLEESSGVTALVMELVEGEDGGIHPVWRHDAKELFYLSPAGEMMAAPITATAGGVAPGAPVALPDGRFLINTALEDGGAPITIVQHWTPEVKK